MFTIGAVQLLSCKGGRDCQDGGWLGLRGHWHWDNQGYRKRWDDACSGAVQYVPTTRYNLISIRLLDEEGYRIQVQQDIITVSQGDRVILEGEKREGLCKLKEGNSVRGGVSRISLEGSLSRGGALRKIATGHEPGQSVVGRRNGAFG